MIATSSGSDLPLSPFGEGQYCIRLSLNRRTATCL